MGFQVITGIYLFQSISHPDRCYVGSGVHILHRHCHHLSLLRKNKHHSVKLQRHYNKYGEADLVWEIIECGEYYGKNHLLAREQGWYEHFQYKNNGLPYFNIIPIAGSPLGTKRSDDTKRKISDAKKGHRPWNLGLKYHHTEEARKNMGWKKGRKLSQETKDKISKIHKGRPGYGGGCKTFESRKKLSESKMHQSEETNQKNRESQIKRWIKWRLERGLSPEPKHKPVKKPRKGQNPKYKD